MNIFLKEWISNLTVSALLGAVVDLILPNSDFKKYIRFITGLIILVVLLQPLLALTDNIGSLDKIIQSNVFDLETQAAAYNTNKFADLQEKQIQNAYKLNLENRIKTHFKNLYDFSVVDTDIEFESGNGTEDIYRINKITLYIEKKDIAVRPVRIDINSSKRADETSDDEYDRELAQDIKKELNELLEISPEVVHIYITN